MRLILINIQIHFNVPETSVWIGQSRNTDGNSATGDVQHGGSPSSKCILTESGIAKFGWQFTSLAERPRMRINDSVSKCESLLFEKL